MKGRQQDGYLLRGGHLLRGAKLSAEAYGTRSPPASFARRTRPPLRTCQQTRVYEGECLPEELGTNRSRLDQLVAREAADDAHHDTSDILRRHGKVGGPEVACPRLERAGKGMAKLRL